MTEFSTCIPVNFELSPAHIDVWMIETPLAQMQLAAFEACLSDEERSRIRRMRIPAKRDEAIISRGLLRQILGRILRTKPHTVALTTGPHGKPALDPRFSQQPIHFNISHTAGRITLAVTLGHEVGVDIERIRPTMAHEELARRFFTAGEYDAIAALPSAERPRAFFKVWCRKEAVLKAMGQGISAGLNSFDVPVTATGCAVTVSRYEDGVETRWLLHDLPVPDPFVACVATHVNQVTLRYWRAEENY